MQPFYERKFFRAGFPLFIFIIGGSFALTTVTKIRYKLSERKQNSGASLEVKRLVETSSKDELFLNDPLKINKEKLKSLSTDPGIKKALNEFIQELSKFKKNPDPDEVEYKEKLEKIKKLTAKQFSKEDEYNKMRNTLDLNNWENKRIPRPYEEKDES